MNATVATSKAIVQYEFDELEACRNLTPQERAAWLMNEGTLEWQYSRLTAKELTRISEQENCPFVLEIKHVERLGFERGDPGVYWRMKKI